MMNRNAAKAAANKRALEEAEAEETTEHEHKKAKVVDAASFAEYELSTHMPAHAVHLVHLFSSLEFSLTTLTLYHRTASFSVFKDAVESSCKSTFSMVDLARIVSVYPEAYDLSYTKPTDKTSRPELCLKASSSSFRKRMATFCAALNSRLVDHLAHDGIPEDLELPEAALPRVEDAMGPTPLAQLRAQEDKHAASLTPLEKATFLAKPVPKELQGLPAALINKVRAAEWQRSALTKKTDGTERIVSTLPQLCDQIQAYATFVGKTAFDVDVLVRNLNKAPIPDKTKDQIGLLAEKVPFWLTLTKHDKTEIVRLNKKQNYRAMKQILTRQTAVDAPQA
ncbi:Aste57867_7959 [Aphanomyces stellatus]|uniref:Aste57867_7959 protein n=1 Tax=Aphanomyces stellatus TaxID=120398 RepID=A0A485KJ35_9STRA|nr:hypothetical protein As57867_007929 [Aphanomyces stellatus]VFT84852.1 Aste57867_7959 [Aphanomyces stellatus]